MFENYNITNFVLSDTLLSSLQEYQTILPEVVTENGEFLSYRVQRNHSTGSAHRNRREARRNQQEILENSDISEYRIFYRFSVFGKEFHFDLTLNTELLSPGFYVEYQDREGVLATSDSISNCYYTGQSREPFISTAAISNCNGLVREIIS
jgi:thrombospondin motif-containing protein 6